MEIRWKRGQGTWMSPTFSPKEFECRGQDCCLFQRLEDHFLMKLEKLRVAVGKPIVVNEGYRCPDYQNVLRNKGYETSKGISSHEMGIAADIKCPGVDKKIFLAEAEKLFNNIGVFPSGTLHVDDRPGGPRRWHYK